MQGKSFLNSHPVSFRKHPVRRDADRGVFTYEIGRTFENRPSLSLGSMREGNRKGVVANLQAAMEYH